MILLVRRLQLFVGGLQFLKGRLRVFLGAPKFVFQMADDFIGTTRAILRTTFRSSLRRGIVPLARHAERRTRGHFYQQDHKEARARECLNRLHRQIDMAHLAIRLHLQILLHRALAPGHCPVERGTQGDPQPIARHVDHVGFRAAGRMLQITADLAREEDGFASLFHDHTGGPVILQNQSLEVLKDIRRARFLILRLRQGRGKGTAEWKFYPRSCPATLPLEDSMLLVNRSEQLRVGCNVLRRAQKQIAART